MPGFSKSEDVVAFLRKLIGEVAEDPSYARVAGVMEPGDAVGDFLGGELLQRGVKRSQLPGPGTGVAILQPEAVIKAQYGALGDEAMERLRNSPYQVDRRGAGPYVPVFLQSGDGVGKAQAQYVHPSYPIQSHIIPEVGVVQAGVDSPHLLRNLVHELRHAMSNDDVLYARPSRSLTNAKVPSLGGHVRMASDKGRKYQSYLSAPREQLTFLGEAGDDFARVHGRLVQNEEDAAEALRMMAEDGMHSMPAPTNRFFLEAFQGSPSARKQITDVLTKVFAVPGAVAAASQDQP